MDCGGYPARNVYRKVTRKIYDFSPEQEQNLLAIVRLYRGEVDRYLELVAGYCHWMLEEGGGNFKTENGKGEITEPLPEFIGSLDALLDASLDDLNPQAIAIARANFHTRNKNKPFATDIDSWSIETFLDRAKINIGGQITRTAILLLGQPEAVHHLQSAVAQITWRLKAEEQAYEHFGPPFLTTTSDLYSRIRNTMQKIDVFN